MDHYGNHDGGRNFIGNTQNMLLDASSTVAEKLCTVAKGFGIVLLIVLIILLIVFVSAEIYAKFKLYVFKQNFKGRRSNLTLRSLKPKQPFGGRRSYLEGIAQTDGCPTDENDPCHSASDINNAQTGGATMRSCSVGSQPGMGGGKTSCGLYATGTTESFSGGAHHETYNQGMRSNFNPYGGGTATNKLNQAMTGR
jgi:hypothetical protein